MNDMMRCTELTATAMLAGIFEKLGHPVYELEASMDTSKPCWLRFTVSPGTEEAGPKILENDIGLLYISRLIRDFSDLSLEQFDFLECLYKARYPQDMSSNPFSQYVLEWQEEHDGETELDVIPPSVRDYILENDYINSLVIHDLFTDTCLTLDCEQYRDPESEDSQSAQARVSPLVDLLPILERKTRFDVVVDLDALRQRNDLPYDQQTFQTLMAALMYACDADDRRMVQSLMDVLRPTAEQKRMQRNHSCW
ncbi:MULTISPECIES: hypothetical protein [Erysipelotrichaceae]|uniref:hypothetical protein n=1 Tax=Erysipelotrichaceae TaxID=128827 RepID=UPI00248F7AD5|nr:MULTISPECIES: hypothetical protein [Erysipelotrichaceae]